uniref:CUB domain-containing protein n=1 Tax=Panagrellus redivivus TaxID=6233 RepID=A0A7E4VU46_PANRE
MLFSAPCPTSSTWYVSSYYDNRLRCLGAKHVPSNLTSPTQLIEVCQSKHPDALPASIHNVDEIIFIKNHSMNGACSGLYLPSGKTFTAANLKNLDGMAVDYLPFNTSSGTSSTNSLVVVSPGMKPEGFVSYITPGLANVICAMWAT